MLTKSSLNAAYPLATVLAEKGWILRPIAETPLAELISASLTHAETVNGVAPDSLATVPCSSTMLIDASSAADPMGVVVHDQIMQSSVKAIGAVVLNNLHMARNVVNPQVMAVAQEVQTFIESQSSSSMAPLSVVPFQYKAIWDSPILAELVSRYAVSPIVDLALLPMGLAPSSSVEASVMTGAGRFDEEIATWLTQGASERLLPVWDSLFGTGSAGKLVDVLSTDRLKIDDVLIAFLFARRVQEEIPTGVNMEISAWRSYAAMILSQAGRAVARIMERRLLDQRNMNLVIVAPNGDYPEGEIIVVGDVYSRFLQEGGSPEVLFGSVLSDRHFGYRELLERSDEYNRVWKTGYSMLQNKVASDRFKFMIAGTRNAVTKLINEIADDQLQCDRGVLHARLKERLTHLQSKHLEDIYKAMRKTVCRVIYPHTDCEAVLNAIDASAAANPELDIREAALLATVDYVSGWICKLFTVEVAPDNGA